MREEAQQKRGRKSAASLQVMATASVLETVPRLQAPHDLTDEEVVVWAAVTATKPADWFDDAAVPLLSQYCRHSVQARRIAEMIERATSDQQLHIADYDRLLKMQQRESAVLSTLSTKLRISPHSQTNHRGNKVPTSGIKKPWEG